MATKRNRSTPTKTAVSEPEPLMYIGPTLARFGVINNVVYAAIPESMTELIAGTPLIGQLFIHIVNYPEAENCINTQTGAVWAAYKEAMQYIGK